MGRCLNYEQGKRNFMAFAKRARRKDKKAEKNGEDNESGGAKVTDNDIIKALECCKVAISIRNCDDCPLQLEECIEGLPMLALDLIKRQKTEIKRLHSFESYRHCRAEAITDFAERLKEKAKMGKGYLGNVYHTVDVCYIDQIAKEMKEN